MAAQKESVTVKVYIYGCVSSRRRGYVPDMIAGLHNVETNVTLI